MSQFIMTEELKAKWLPVIEAEGASPITTTAMKNTVIQVLENMVVEAGNTNDTSIVDPGNNGTGYSVNGQINPVLISLVRRAMPALIANDIIGVQPMSAPTGLIFALRSYRGTDKATRTETFVPGTQNSALNSITTAAGEVLGTQLQVAGGATDPANDPVVQANPWEEVSFGISKTSVEAKTRAMKASYTQELAQDLKAQHGLDAETELANLLTQEVLTEMNREIVTLVRSNATAETETLATSPIATAGKYDVDVADGRWAAEKYRMLAAYISRQASKIARSTGRGQGNFIITSPDVANALDIAGTLTSAPVAIGLENTSGIGVTLAGTMLGGRIKVYVDQYNTTDEVLVGYKGSSAYDAGLFYCPYVPLQMMKAIGENDFQPRIGFKSRYGLASNPFGATAYYRKFQVVNLLQG